MLNSIISGLQSQLGSELQQKAGVTSDMAQKILQETGNIATSEVKKEAINGGMDTLMNLFSNKPNSKQSNQLQKNITDALVGSLSTKFKLPKAKATMIAGIVIPALMSLVTKENSKTKDSDPSPLESLFDLAGKGGAGKSIIGGILGKFLK